MVQSLLPRLAFGLHDESGDARALSLKLLTDALSVLLEACAKSGDAGMTTALQTFLVKHFVSHSRALLLDRPPMPQVGDCTLAELAEIASLIPLWLPLCFAQYVIRCLLSVMQWSSAFATVMQRIGIVSDVLDLMVPAGTTMASVAATAAGSRSGQGGAGSGAAPARRPARYRQLRAAVVELAQRVIAADEVPLDTIVGLGLVPKTHLALSVAAQDEEWEVCTRLLDIQYTILYDVQSGHPPAVALRSSLLPWVDVAPVAASMLSLSTCRRWLVVASPCEAPADFAPGEQTAMMEP